MAAALAALVGLTACGGGGGDDEAEALDDEPPVEIAAEGGVETTTLTFVDPARPTSASPVTPAADERTLETLIAHPDPLDGPYPLVVLAHGLGGHPSRLSSLMETWAEAGYVVAAPAFPRTNDAQPGGQEVADVSDLANQPGDVSFVIDSLLASELADHIDSERIGLAGHSLGGATAVGTVFNTCCTDERIDAVALLAVAPPELFGLFAGELDPRPIPTLMLVADGDFIYDASEAVYPMLSPPKWYVTFHGEDDPMRHVGPFEDAPDPADDLVLELTTAFWDLELTDDAAAQARLEEAAEPEDGSATLQTVKE
jgi:dienelactone hydrolase